MSEHHVFVIKQSHSRVSLCYFIDHVLEIFDTFSSFASWERETKTPCSIVQHASLAT